MFEVRFYRDRSGNSDIVDYLDELKKRGETSKRELVNRDKILAYIGALEQFGTRIGLPMVRHIEGDLWELRPMSNRIFFFYWREKQYVLLHHFIKKSQKTPRKEIAKAKAKMDDFLERYGENDT